VLFGQIDGHVYDARTSLPLQGVYVTTDRYPFHDTTDAQGQFTMEKIPPGDGSIVRLIATSPNSWYPKVLIPSASNPTASSKLRLNLKHSKTPSINKTAPRTSFRIWQNQSPPSRGGAAASPPAYDRGKALVCPSGLLEGGRHSVGKSRARTTPERLRGDLDALIKLNRDLEKKLTDLGGRKVLYAHSYYPRREFWKIYDEKWYKGLRKKYHAEAVFPDIYDKTHVVEVYEVSFWSGLWNVIKSPFKLPLAINH